MSDEWRTVDCWRCGGWGLVSRYTVGGGDFEGAGECPDCDGAGRLWIRPSDHVFAYPGGPARGRAPGKYATARALPTPSEPNPEDTP